MRKLSLGPGRRRGFTLLELLVVMVIIGLLAGLVAPRYFAQVGKSQVKIARSQIDALEKALDQYRIDMGRYPTTEEGLDSLMNAPLNEPNWAGPYLKKAVPLDPWGHPVCLRQPGYAQQRCRPDVVRKGRPAGRHRRKRRPDQLVAPACNFAPKPWIPTAAC